MMITEMMICDDDHEVCEDNGVNEDNVVMMTITYMNFAVSYIKNRRHCGLIYTFISESQ
jgi:hypothetical protein